MQGPRDQLRREVRDLVRSWAEDGRIALQCDSWIRGWDLAFSQELARRGWVGMTWPKDLGGGAGSHLDRLVVTEELVASGAPVAAHWFADRQVGPSLLRHGTRRLQEELLPAITRGEATFAIGMSEPDAGSDLAAVRTTAVRSGDHYRVQGTKLWTSQAHRATHVYLLARTDPAAERHAGLGELIVDLDSPGVEVRPVVDLRGEHHFNEVHFDDVRVPAHRLVGTEGDGWRQVMEQLSFERGGPERFLSTMPLLEAALARLRDVDPAQGAAGELGGLLARYHVLRAQAWEIARAMDRGQAPAGAAAALKLAGPVLERDVIDTIRRLLPSEPPDPSATGLRRDLSDAVLAAPTFTLRGGASEVLVGVVARTADEVTTSPGDVRQVADQVLSVEHDEPWRVVCDLGWPLVGIPESHGGAGGTLTDLVELVRAVGHHTVNVPLAARATGAWVAATSGMLPVGSDIVTSADRLLEPVDSDGSRVSGTLHRVPGSSGARHLVAGAGPDEQLVLIDLEGRGVRRLAGKNVAGEDRDDLVLEAAPTLASSDGPSWAAVRRRTLLLRIAATVGVIDRVVDTTRRYVQERRQFGRRLADFQLVQSGLATLVVEQAMASAALERALDASSPVLASPAVDAAAVVVERAASVVARVGHQLHGAMGTTLEYPLHRATTRLWAWADDAPTGAMCASTLGTSLLSADRRAWETVTRTGAP